MTTFYVAAGAKIAADAALEGLEVPALYSVSRDGAVHGFSYIVDDACRPTASTADASQGDGVAVDGTSAFAGTGQRHPASCTSLATPQMHQPLFTEPGAAPLSQVASGS